MKLESSDTEDPRIQNAIAELKALILEGFPDATFEVTVGEDPLGVYLIPTVDTDDTDDAFELVRRRLYEMQLDEGLDLYVFPRVTAERLDAIWKELRARGSPWALPQLAEP